MPHSVIPHAILIAVKDEHVLLLRRHESAPFGGGHYSLVGGKVDAGESFSQAIIREAEEEAGIHIQAKDLVYAHTLYAHCSDAELVAVTFVAKVWQREARNAEPHKHESIGWYSPKNLPGTLLPLNQIVLDCWQQGTVYYEYQEF